MRGEETRGEKTMIPMDRADLLMQKAIDGEKMTDRELRDFGEALIGAPELAEEFVQMRRIVKSAEEAAWTPEGPSPEFADRVMERIGDLDEASELRPLPSPEHAEGSGLSSQLSLSGLSTHSPRTRLWPLLLAAAVIAALSTSVAIMALTSDSFLSMLGEFAVSIWVNGASSVAEASTPWLDALGRTNWAVIVGSSLWVIAALALAFVVAGANVWLVRTEQSRDS